MGPKQMDIISTVPSKQELYNSVVTLLSVTRMNLNTELIITLSDDDDDLN